MSSKILNASAWDDLTATGEIGALTLQQCGITRRLLNDSINDGQEGSDVTVAALIAVLLFDVCLSALRLFGNWYADIGTAAR